MWSSTFKDVAPACVAWGLVILIGILAGLATAQIVQQPSPRGRLPWACIVAVGDPGAGSPTLAADNDTPLACANDGGTDITITGVACAVDSATGTPTMNVKESTSGGASILTGAISCGTGWTAGTLSGSPVLHSYSTLTTCSSAPCVYYLDYDQSSAGAKYVIVKITGTRP